VLKREVLWPPGQRTELPDFIATDTPRTLARCKVNYPALRCGAPLAGTSIGTIFQASRI